MKSLDSVIFKNSIEEMKELVKLRKRNFLV